jgi:hypothetical protein
MVSEWFRCYHQKRFRQYRKLRDRKVQGAPRVAPTPPFAATADCRHPPGWRAPVPGFRQHHPRSLRPGDRGLSATAAAIHRVVRPCRSTASGRQRARAACRRPARCIDARGGEPARSPPCAVRRANRRSTGACGGGTRARSLGAYGLGRPVTWRGWEPALAQGCPRCSAATEAHRARRLGPAWLHAGFAPSPLRQHQLMRLAVSRHQQESTPPLVRHGNLRHCRQDPSLPPWITRAASPACPEAGHVDAAIGATGQMLVCQSMPSFFNLYRSARKVMPSFFAAAVLL